MRELTIRDALNEALREEIRRDPRVFMMGTDIAHKGGTFGVTKGLVEEFGEDRVMDGPISEAGLVGCALGAAITGLRPIIDISQTDWITIAMDQITNQVAKIRYMVGGKVTVPMVIKTAEGAGRGNAAQHSQTLEAWFVHMPGLYVVTHSTAYDAKGLLKSAIRNDNPVLFLDHRIMYNIKGPVPDEEYLVPLGIADVKRTGRDVTVVATQMMVHKSLAAAAELAAEGIDLEVVDLRTLVPFDAETVLASVRKTGRLVVVHEGSTRCGIGADVVAQVVKSVFDYLDAPPVRVAFPDVHMPYSRKLESLVIPSKERIAAACREVCGRGTAAEAPVAVASGVGPATANGIEVLMPKLTTTMEEGKVLRWLKREGDPVEKGEPLFEMETDKASIEAEAPSSGRLVRIIASEGATLPIGAPIAIIG